MRVVALWSGGKESCFSCYKAISKGFEVSYLLNFISKDGRCMSHGIDSKLIVAQSQAIEIPIVQGEVTWDTYEQEFKTVVRELKQMGVDGAVFGDIEIQEHKDWVDRVCNEVDIKPVMPLWGHEPERVLTDFIDEGFEAIVVMVKADLFGEEWLGRRVDESFVRDLLKLKNKVHLCGELGEYHTYVTDGSFFKRRIKILDSSRILKDGYRFLDISKHEVSEKRS